MFLHTINSANKIGFHKVNIDTSLLGNIFAEFVLKGIARFSAKHNTKCKDKQSNVI